ncbi:MAG: hypothetical protein ACRCSL_06190 [Microbacterium sp.]
MESRTRLAIGGLTTVAASVTVICIVALTNSLALSESAGSSVGAAPIVVPASDEDAAEEGSTPTATPRATPSPEPEPEPQTEEPTDSAAPPTAEVVPAPDAQVVTPVRPSPAAEQPSRPSGPATVEEAIAQAEASGSWAPLRTWAESQGWSAGRIDALIKKLERARADYQVELGTQRTTDAADAGRVQAPAQDVHDGGAGAGSSQEHRANAGEKADRRTEKSDHGSQKDRDTSPHRRDR